MANRLLLFLALLTTGLLTQLLGCSRSGSQPAVGGLYHTQNDNGSYSVLKVLKVDAGGVHLRLYSNQFPSPPTRVDENTLYLAGPDRKPNESVGIEHAPVSTRSFRMWTAVFFQQSTVTPGELAGYQAWLEVKGGYIYSDRRK